jgi:hypothetical protein
VPSDHHPGRVHNAPLEQKAPNQDLPRVDTIVLVQPLKMQRLVFLVDMLNCAMHEPDFSMAIQHRHRSSQEGTI